MSNESKKPKRAAASTCQAGRRNHDCRFAVYEDESVQGLAEIRKRIDAIVAQMEDAIAHQAFEKARFYSDEEQREREKLRRLRAQLNIEEPSPVPFLRIDVVGNDPFTEVLERCEAYISGGVAAVWVLAPALKRVWTVSQAYGLREFRGKVLRTEKPPLEMELSKVFLASGL